MSEPIDDTEAQVRAAYRWILGREPDAAGLAFYCEALRSGQADLAGLREIFLSCQEFLQNRGSHGVEERSFVNQRVIRSTGGIVQTGPFAGMRMIDMSARGDGDIAPKLLGVYEQELHPAFTKFSTRRYDAIVDVGCAEGYYSVGAARLFPGTPVLAYDTDPAALDILMDLARANGCAEQMVPGAFCDPAELREVVRKYPRSLVIADCEGYEKALFSDPATNAVLASSDLIIECHDLWDADITPSIRAALDATHDIGVAMACGRDPNAFEFLAELSDWDRWRAVWERRGSRMHWLICEGRAAGR
jgi:hypothetical protein